MRACLCVRVYFETEHKAGVRSPVQVSLNIKEEHDGEHLRLTAVAATNIEDTIEGSVALCYSFVLSFHCLLWMYVHCVYVRLFFLCSLFPIC